MLVHLRAQNLGLIRDAYVDPGPGLTVITGETGAGKTLLLGALRLLMGDSSDSAMVGAMAENAQADGLFTGVSEMGVTRVVPRDGRSRSYIDGKVVSAKVLQKTLDKLVQVVGQHDQLELRKPRFVLDLLDSNLDDSGKKALHAYSETWATLQRALEEQQLLGGSQLELTRELDLVRYQTREISEAGFSQGDDDVLETQNLRLRNASEIRENLRGAIGALEVAESSVGDLISHLRKVTDLDRASAPVTEAAEGVGYAITEISRDLASNVESLVDDPGALADIESRLNLLGDLKMKYGRTLDEILSFWEKTSAREEELVRLLERGLSIDAEVRTSRKLLDDAGRKLAGARRFTADRLAKAIASHLNELAMDTASVVFDFSEIEPGPRGADRIQILFSSHASLVPGDLSKVASGGELSRLVLAVNLSSRGGGARTLVFDEVDAGVGGATALAMARKLASLAETQQVVCVTHLPQVAAFADSHFVVTRTGADAAVARADGEERLAELSRMIAGLPESDRGQQAAAELLELAAS